MRYLIAVLTVALLALAAACGGDEGRGPGGKQYREPPPRTIDTSRTYIATIKTEKGDIELELLPQKAPIAVNNFVFLAREGFYDGLTFHRVEPGFVIQGGDPLGEGTGGPGYTIQDEFNDTPFEAAVLGMARTQAPNSAGSQFFITLNPAPHLTGQYTAFGRVTAGMEVAEQIAVGDVIETIAIQEQ